MSLYADTIEEAEANAHPLPPFTSYSFCQTCGGTLVTCGNQWVHRDGANSHAPHPPAVIL